MDQQPLDQQGTGKQSPAIDKYIQKFKANPILYGGIAIAVIILLICIPAMFMGSEVIKNPAPIRVGNTVFAPQVIVKHLTRQEWKDVTITSGRQKGSIKELEIGQDWANASGISLPDAEIGRLEVKGVAGGWEKAAATLAMFKNKMPVSAQEFSNIPPVKVDSIKGENMALADAGVNVRIKSLELLKCEFPQKVGKSNLEGITITQFGREASIAEVSAAKIEIPQSGDIEDAVIKDLKIKNILVPAEGVKIKLIEQNMDDGKYHLEIDDFQVKGGELLGRWPNAPREINGSVDLTGKASKGNVVFDGKIKANNLADISGVLKGRYNLGHQDFDPGMIDLKIRDRGLVTMLDPQTKALLMMLGGPILGSELQTFLTQPGKQMKIKGSFTSGAEQLSVTVD